jgi:hypothetical protein
MCLSSCSKYHKILEIISCLGGKREGRKGIQSSIIEPQLLLLSDSPCEQIMKVTQRMSPLGMLAFAVVAVGVLSFITGAPLVSLTPALAQETTNATTTDSTTTTTANATSPETEATPEEEAGTETTPPAMTEEHEHTSNETATGGTTTVRDSVLALLSDQTIPASGFIHLYDTSPYSIINGHVAAKIPCDDESAPLLNIIVGAAPQFTPAPLELVANLSTAGELCLYHVDLPAPGPEQQANTTNTTTTAAAANTTATAAIITDIAIQNPGDEDITLPSTSTVVIGINEIEKGAHTHEEGE